MVDDDADDIFIFEELLKQTAPNILFESNMDPKEAIHSLQKAEEPLPELIILDINMPVLNGREFLKLIKTHEQLAEIPVVIYSTSNSVEEARLMMQLGAHTMITKPHDISSIKALQLELLQYLNNRLRNKVA